MPDRENLLPADRALLERYLATCRTFCEVREALARVESAVRVTAPGPVRVLPRRRPGAAVVHVLNRDYRPDRDDVEPQHGVRVQVNRAAWGVAGASTCRLCSPEASEPVWLPVSNGAVTVPVLRLWSVLEFDPAAHVQP